jgi:hypothetical protein
MPPKPRKIFLALSGTLTITALICGAIGLRSQPGSRIWHHVFYGLLFLNLFLMLFMLNRYPGNKATPNPLIDLFPKPQQPQKDDTL